MKWVLAASLALLVAFTPGKVAAAEDDPGDLLVRIGGNVLIAEGETAGSVVVINGDAEIGGRVTDSVVVIDGNVVVTGTIEGDLTVISGTANLAAGSTVDDVSLIRSDLSRAEGANVTGNIDEQDNFGLAGGFIALFSILFWLAMTVAVIISGLIFAAVGGRQLISAARTTTGEAVNTLLGVVFVWIALPFFAGIAVVTLVGLPLGLGVLLFVLPALWFLGLIVAGTRLGLAIVKASGREPGLHPYLASFVGLLILQILILVPVIGAIVVLLAGAWGAGALAYVAFRAAGGKGLTGSEGTPSRPDLQPS